MATSRLVLGWVNIFYLIGIILELASSKSYFVATPRPQPDGIISRSDRERNGFSGNNQVRGNVKGKKILTLALVYSQGADLLIGLKNVFLPTGFLETKSIS